MRTAGPTPVARRRVLLGAAGAPLLLAALTALSVSACTDDPPAAPPADPDREALESARRVEVELRTTLLAWTPEPTPGGPAPQSRVLGATALAVVDGHLSALDAALGTATLGTATLGTSTGSSSASSPAPSPSSTDLPVSTATVVTSLDAAVDEHTRALRSASPAISPLLASIGASDAALGAAVRRSVR